MKKSGRRIELGWRLWSLIICGLILIGVAGFSYATNSGNPSIMGHSADEIAGGAGNAVAATLSCVNRTATSPVVGAGDGVTVSVVCNSDEIATGGGGYCGGGNCFGSKPIKNGWQIYAFSSVATANVICCKVTGSTATPSNFNIEVIQHNMETNGYSEQAEAYCNTLSTTTKQCHLGGGFDRDGWENIYCWCWPK